MSRENAGDLTFSEQYNGPDPLLDAARTHSHEFGLVPVSQTTASTLTLLARLLTRSPLSKSAPASEPRHWLCCAECRPPGY